MNKLTEEYQKVIDQRESVIKEIEILVESEKVKRYLELQNQNEILSNKQFDLYKSIKEEEYASCNHIFVYSKVNYDRYGYHTYKSCGCIKCGLDNSVFHFNREDLPSNKQVMFDYLRKNNFHIKGIETKVVCDLDLAQAIYSKIKMVHPNIDDTTAIKYFEIALDNIRNNEVSDDRKISRAKRLSLKPDFRKWDGIDVHIY